MRASIAFILLSLLVVGCTSSIAHHVPTVVPPGREALHARDSEACEAATPRDGEGRGLIYAACMIERGYTAVVDLPTWPATRAVYMDVTKTGEPQAVVADVTACREAATKRVDADTGAKVARFAVPWVGFSMQGNAAQDAFRACLTPRGYTATPWRGR